MMARSIPPQVGVADSTEAKLPVTARSEPSALRWLIGAELSRYRRDVPMSLSELSTASGIGKPKLGHMETGRHQQFPDDISAVLRACGADQPAIERLTSLAARSDTRSWIAPWSQVLPDFLKIYVGLEGMADGLFTFESMVLPGLLQTAGYAENLTRATGFFRPDQAERFAAFRQVRARRLTDDEPLAFHCVVGEAALRMPVGAAEVWREQLEHLLHLTERPNITLQILRPEDGPHRAGAIGKFALFEFAEIRPVAYTELLDDAVYVQDLDRVRTYQWMADNLRQVALSPAASLALIREIAGAT
jgi:hypothetical protein